MILFSSLKPFTKETLPVQLSAIRSWKRALPEARVILYGNEPGLVDVCRKEKVDFGGSVKVGHDGVEIVTDIFRQAAFHAGRAGMIYLNSDILLDEFARFQRQLASFKFRIAVRT